MDQAEAVADLKVPNLVAPTEEPLAGSILVWTGTEWNCLAPGSNNQVLKIVDGMPEWATDAT